MIERLLDLAVLIQQIPAPTFKEGKRAQFVRERLSMEGLADVDADRSNNVYARLPGSSRGAPLVVSAHLDTVFASRRIPLERSINRIHGPGIGDNSLGVAALFGLVWMLREAGTELASDVWLVANSCEEGLGDLRGMKEVVRRFGSDVRGYLVLEGTALGQVYHRAIGVRRYRVIVSTGGGHSWSDYGRPSAVHELAKLVTRISELRLPERPRSTVNVGTIAGGTGINVVASRAQFELDVRSEEALSLDALVRDIEHKVLACRREGVEVRMEPIGHRPAGEISVDHPFVRLAVEVLAGEGIEATLTAGSTDANVPLSLGLPAIVLGLTTGAGAHTTEEYIDTPPVATGMRQLVNYVSALMKAG